MKFEGMSPISRTTGRLALWDGLRNLVLRGRDRQISRVHSLVYLANSRAVGDPSSKSKVTSAPENNA